MLIKENLNNIRNNIPENICLIAVSKYQSVSAIMQAYQAGQRVFGENKAQELSLKYPQLPEDIQWHFIGHLQTNKVKLIAPFVNVIHSVDSLKLLIEINKEAENNKRIIDCFLQIYIASEETKFGLSYAEAKSILDSEDYKNLNSIRITGVMGMASFTDKMQLVRQEFRKLNEVFNQLKNNYFQNIQYFKECSSGMSHDYIIAIEEGSTLVRIGTAIFGER